MQKESPRTRGFEGCYSHYFAGGFVLRRCRNSIRRYSAAPKREFRSQFPLFPLNSRKLSPVCSSLPQFVLVCPVNTQSQKLPRIRGVKSGSRIPGRGRALSWVTVGHGNWSSRFSRCSNHKVTVISKIGYRRSARFCYSSAISHMRPSAGFCVCSAQWAAKL